MSECFTKYSAVKIEQTNACESICCYKDLVLIGTRQGFILSYRISYDERAVSSKNYVKSEFRFLMKDFTRKPITQIQVIEELGFIISLSDGNVFIHRINDYKLISIVENKRVIKITADVHNPEDLQLINAKKGSDNFNKKDDNRISQYILDETLEKKNPNLRVCLTTKKKLIIMNWSVSDNKFVDADKDIKLPEVVKTSQFFFDCICVGTRTEYSMININTGENICSFNVGRCQEPFLMRVANMMAMKIDDVVEFFDWEGTLLSNGTLRWSFVPSNLLYHPPFAIAVVEKFVEVRMITPTLHIQSLPFDCASLICRYMDRVYVLSDKTLYILKSRSRQSLVHSYSDNEDFELALILAKTAPLVGESIIECTKININYSLNLFKNRQFEKAFNIFSEMRIDPFDVLHLFPSLCPEKVIKQLKYTAVSEDFTEEESKEAIHSLIEYLVKWHYRLLYSKNEQIDCRTMSDGSTISQQKYILEQIVDTSLLKCYLIINSPLITSLLKQKNACHLDEAKKSLLDHKKYQELVLLFESHEKHDEALNLLHSQSVKSHSPLFGIYPTLRYMKNLNPDHLDLIYEYGDWILAKNPMEWLNIFTYWDHVEKTSSDEDKRKFRSYKENVLKHLKSKAPELVIPFLERIIYDNKMFEDFDFETDSVDCDNINPLSSLPNNQRKVELLQFDDAEPLPINDILLNDRILHTSYVSALIQKILSLRSTSLLSINIKSELENPAPDSKYVYQLRVRLKSFLESNLANYSTDVLSDFPYDAFYEERALVLAKAGKDEQALTLWIYLLNNWPQALSHCTKSYEHKNDIFFKLLNICVDPSDPASIGIVIPVLDLAMICNKKCAIYNNQFTPKLDKALEILKKYGDKLSVLPTIKLLSSSFKVNDLLPFIQNSLRRQSTMLNQAVYLRNLQFSTKLQSNLQLYNSSKKFFVMEPESKCSVCKKSMGASALARYPDGSLLHYGCCKDLLKSTF